MAGVAQLVEHLSVDQVVAGSNPVARPILLKFVIFKMRAIHTKTVEKVSVLLPSFIGVILVISALFVVVALVSYTPIDIYSANGDVLFNKGGKVGSGLAHFLLQYFGLSACLIPFFVFTWGIVLFYRHKIYNLSLKIILALLSILFTSFLLGNLHNIENIFSFLIGGYAGFMMNSILQGTIFFFPLYVFALIATPLATLASSGIHTFNIPSKIQKLLSLIFTKFQNETKPNNTEDEPLLRSITKEQASEIRIKNINEVRKMSMKQNATTANLNDILEEKPTINKKTREEMVIIKSIPINQKEYIPPAIDFLAKNSSENNKKNAESNKQAQIIQVKLKQVLIDFGIEGEIVSFSVGPVITMFEFEPKAGIRSSRIIGLSEDIARSLKAKSARISIIPDKSSLAIEIPNIEREIVYFRELIESNNYNDSKHALPLCLGKDISGRPIIVDLSKMPHLLVAGTTGSGKSIGINSMIMSILYKLSPEECKLIMIDPKMLELSVYEGIPHLMTPVVTDPEKAALTLQWVTKEMEKRYKAMAKIGVRNIFNYNSYIEENHNANIIEAQETEGFDPKHSRDDDLNEGKKMPYIIVIVDEMADLMLTAGKTVEASIQRLAQMARAAGIHIIMATQRPSVDVITGIIKANFPTRIAFQVTSKIDSRTILGYQGAESLLGKGDMLYMPTGSKTYRVHSPFVDDKEVGKVVQYLKQNYPNKDPNYGKITLEIEKVIKSEDDSSSEDEGDLYKQAVAIVRDERKASISYLQRRLRIGYNKAANFIEQMELDGIVSAQDHTGKRVVIE